MPGVQSKSIFRRFEGLIDPSRTLRTSPARPRAALLRLLPATGLADLRRAAGGGLAGALVEVALFSFLADIVDLARDTPPAEFFQRHAGLLLWMAVVVMVLRRWPSPRTTC